MAVLRRHRARLSFTCVEMRDCEHPPEGRCSPQGEPAGVWGTFERQQAASQS